MERWRPVTICPEYAVSDQGRVFSFKGNQYLTVSSAYLVHLTYGGWRKPARVSRLVLEAFGPPRLHNNYVPIHRNSIGADSRLENLYWGPPSGNGAMASKAGRTGSKANKRRALEKMALPPSMDDIFEKKEWE